MHNELTIEESQLFIHVPRRLRHVIVRGLKKPSDTHLNRTQFMTVMLLKENGTVPMHFLGSIIGMEKGSLTQVVDKLVDLGMVERNRDPEDRRLVLVQLSPEGRRFADEMQGNFNAHLRQVLEALDEDEVKDLIESLKSIQKIVEKIEENKGE